MGCLAFAFAFNGCTKPRQEESPTETPIAQQAFSVFAKYCAQCHGEGKRVSDKFKLDRGTMVTAQQKVVPGSPDQSRVILRMTDSNRPMPPPNVEARPTAEEIEIVRKWIAEGAADWK